MKLMIRTIFACFNGKVSHKKAEVEPLEVTKPVYRDELTKKQPPRKTVKKTVRFAESEPTILGEDSEKEFEKTRWGSGNEVGEKEGMRVRIKLTKEEAARLLSKCNNGGILQFKDVAHELVLIPVNRVSVAPDAQC
ncbi:hypothetical protein JHK82_020248 [Glycine max]|nr:hypothetical protein JHK85_020701 [Glycine max]KAG5135517.1 hypothetical protein JHK82_020248 [Glycine max]